MLGEIEPGSFGVPVAELPASPICRLKARLSGLLCFLLGEKMKTMSPFSFRVFRCLLAAILPILLWASPVRGQSPIKSNSPVAQKPSAQNLPDSRPRLIAQTGTDAVFSVAFSPDGKYVLTDSVDGTTGLWEADTGNELCQMLSFDDGAWAVVDPQGRFDASNGGSVSGLHWAVGNRSIDLSQLKERYYEPGLLSKIFQRKPLRQVDAFTDVPLFPEVVSQQMDGTRLQVTLHNLGGGIGKVQVYVNDALYLEDARPADRRKPDAPTLALSLDLASAPTWRANGPNTVRVVPYNAAGWLPARGIVVVSAAAPGETKVTRHLYAIVAGINAYAAPELHLHFAAQDAVRFAAALQRGARHFFGAENVTLLLLTTADTRDSPGLPAPLSPTRANFIQAFETVRRKARPEDVAVSTWPGTGLRCPSRTASTAT